MIRTTRHSEFDGIDTVIHDALIDVLSKAASTMTTDPTHPDMTSTHVLLAGERDGHQIEVLLCDAPNERFDVEQITRLDDVLEHLTHDRYDALLIDLALLDPADRESQAVLDQIYQRALALPILVLTTSSSDPLGVEALAEGAQDVLVKSELTPATLARAIRHAIARKRSHDHLHPTTAHLEKNNQELQALLERVSHLEQLKTDMIRIASHDLGGMSSIILGYCDLIQVDLWETLDEEHRRWMVDIETTANRMITLTSNILTLERIEAGTLFESVDLPGLLAESFENQRHQAEHKSQSLALTMSDQTMDLEGDATQLREAIMNLIGNAIKYTPVGGKVTISLERHGDRAIFEVHDTGFGIPERMQENLFQPFYRVSTRETREIKGTGLGLHLVKNIIERHHGRMRFHSEYGKGSMFGFELPLTQG